MISRHSVNVPGRQHGDVEPSQRGAKGGCPVTGTCGHADRVRRRRKDPLLRRPGENVDRANRPWRILTDQQVRDIRDRLSGPNAPTRAAVVREYGMVFTLTRVCFNQPKMAAFGAVLDRDWSV